MSEKLSTAEILAAIRSGSASAEKSAPPESSASPSETPAESPAAAAGAPSGTPSILDAIRAGGNAPAADKPAAEKPSSTAEILAAARSGGAGGSKPAGGSVPEGTSAILAAVRGGGAAAPAAKKKKTEVAVPAIDPAAVSGLSVSEMIQAARAGQSPEEAETRPVALPAKPLRSKTVVKPVAKKTETVQRRGFLGSVVAWMTAPIVIAWTSLCATVGIASLATARFMMPNVLVEPPTKFKIGPPSDYSPGTVSTKWKAQFGVWIVNAEVDGAQMVYALSTVCTHLGCTPNWLEGEQKFKCPCHGSGFRKTGVNFEGPAPRPLERMGIRLAPDGMLEVDKSVKFQQELGQWENAASYVPVV
ncbi:MAG: Rieske (2Fe-2S) protein [Fuerstiella sp.]|nr:Rieske (2Fe-2S) protein [Fuerstiella sp.]